MMLDWEDRTPAPPARRRTRVLMVVFIAFNVYGIAATGVYVAHLLGF